MRKDRSGKEKDKWEEVVAKVDARFDAVVKGVQGEVHEWYVGIRTKEGGVVSRYCCRSRNMWADVVDTPGCGSCRSYQASR